VKLKIGLALALVCASISLYLGRDRDSLAFSLMATAFGAASMKEEKLT
jgi:hypothetical protein